MRKNRNQGSGIREKTYQRKIHQIAALYAGITLGVPALLYVWTGDGKAGLLSLAGFLCLCRLSYKIHRLDDAYITGVVAQLSQLTDILVELEEKEIFPDCEDTVVSKLQSKIIKLVRILKSQREREEQEHESIKRLVSDISHQLKTPISNLKMYSEFLAQEELSEEKQKEYVDILCLSVERLNFLSENMIKISRLESGLIHLNMQKQSLNETVLKAVKDIYPKAKLEDVEIKYQEEGRMEICHDRNWTAEAVFNLLDNAVKYSPKGGKVVLTIRKLGMFVEVSVEDENGAIPREEQNKIFSRFYRGKNSRNREGVGVGLYLTREIAVKQGGYLHLKTTGKGNIFSLVLYIQ